MTNQTENDDGYAPYRLTALFQRQYLVTESTPGANDWSEAEVSRGIPTIDQQIEEWVMETNHWMVFVSPPGYDIAWIDQDQLTKSVIVGVSVIYRPYTGEFRPNVPREPISRTTSNTPRPFDLLSLT